jgi:hypothetical protein
MSASILQISLQRSLWLLLAIEADLVPVTLLEDVGDQPWCTLKEDKNFEFLQSPWEVRNGVCVVKGTKCRFEPDAQGGPFTKYMALFDSRTQFDNLRESFLHRACGRRLERLGQALVRYMDIEVAIDGGALQAVRQYLHQFRWCFDVTPSRIDCPAGFADSAWSLLVDCMCDEKRQFFLSANEL